MNNFFFYIKSLCAILIVFLNGRVSIIVVSSFWEEIFRAEKMIEGYYYFYQGRLIKYYWRFLFARDGCHFMISNF